MKGSLPICSIIAGLIVLGANAGAMAQPRTAAPPARPPAQARELPPYLQCVPYAREVSGIELYGDAHTWWHQAEGIYQRGNQPRIGAVMAFIPTVRMQLGHVATVAKVIDRRTVLLDHANWSPIDGRRGQIERGVRAVDVSPGNDWSEVRVWYHPLQDLGTTRWPVAGFIYADGKPKKAGPETRSVAVPAPQQQGSLPAVLTAKPSRDFSKAFASLGEPVGPPTATGEVKAQLAPARSSPPPIARKPVAKPRPAPQGDPYAAVLAKYD